MGTRSLTLCFLMLFSLCSFGQFRDYIKENDYNYTTKFSFDTWVKDKPDCQYSLSMKVLRENFRPFMEELYLVIDFYGAELIYDKGYNNMSRFNFENNWPDTLDNIIYGYLTGKSFFCQVYKITGGWIATTIDNNYMIIIISKGDLKNNPTKK